MARTSEIFIKQPAPPRGNPRAVFYTKNFQAPSFFGILIINKTKGERGMNKVCLQCGAPLSGASVNQLYCCSKCGVQYRKTHNTSKNYPKITFNCSQCGKEVTTSGDSTDRRTRFCCQSCEKKYWRHPHWENPSTRINFRSIAEYASYERRTNESA